MYKLIKKLFGYTSNGELIKEHNREKQDKKDFKIGQARLKQKLLQAHILQYRPYGY